MFDSEESDLLNEKIEIITKEKKALQNLNNFSLNNNFTDRVNYTKYEEVRELIKEGYKLSTAVQSKEFMNMIRENTDKITFNFKKSYCLTARRVWHPHSTLTKFLKHCSDILTLEFIHDMYVIRSDSFIKQINIKRFKKFIWGFLIEKYENLKFFKMDPPLNIFKKESMHQKIACANILELLMTTIFPSEFSAPIDEIVDVFHHVLNIKKFKIRNLDEKIMDMKSCNVFVIQKKDIAHIKIIPTYSTKFNFHGSLRYHNEILEYYKDNEEIMRQVFDLDEIIENEQYVNLNNLFANINIIREDLIEEVENYRTYLYETYNKHIIVGDIIENISGYELILILFFANIVEIDLKNIHNDDEKNKLMIIELSK